MQSMLLQAEQKDVEIKELVNQVRNSLSMMPTYGTDKRYE